MDNGAKRHAKAVSDAREGQNVRSLKSKPKFVRFTNFKVKVKY